MALLSDAEVQTALESLAGWRRERNEILKEFEFQDFVRAVGFVSSVALLAERSNHHPNIDIRWNKVVTSLSTHSQGGITTKDVALAKEIEELAK